MRIMTADDVRAALPMSAAIEAMRTAFRALAEGRVAMPQRTALTPPGAQGTLLVMPAALSEPGSLGAKLVTVFPQNRARGLPLVGAVVLLIDAVSGRPNALLEGAALTALRTGAASGLATDLLARPEARTAAIFGTGVQARTQLEAVCTVRQVERVWVVSRTREHAERFAREMAGRAPVPPHVEVMASARRAVAGADIVCTATGASSPVFDGADVRPGTHVNAIGSFTRDMRELDPGLLPRARVVVDQREAARREAGEVIACLEAGTLAPSDLVELGEVVASRAAGRGSAAQVTVFKSVGLAVQDVVAAEAALAAARARHLGREVEL